MTTDWARSVDPATAAINSVRFYVCPSCGACVMDWDWAPVPSNGSTRQRHEQWHAEEET